MFILSVTKVLNIGEKVKSAECSTDTYLQSSTVINIFGSLRIINFVMRAKYRLFAP